MEETRSQLSEKLEILETQLTDTVQSTTAAVNDTVDAVKDTVESVTGSVQDTVQSVGEALDLRLQTERHPWLVFGGSVAVGYLASGYLFPSRTPAATWPTAEMAAVMANQATASGQAVPVAGMAVPMPVAPPRETWFGAQMKQLRGFAIAALMDMVRDAATKGFPRANVRPPDGSPDSDAPTAPFRANVAGKRTA